MARVWSRARALMAAGATAVLLGAALPAVPAAAAGTSLLDVTISSRSVDVTAASTYVTVKAKLSRAGGLVEGQVVISLRPSAGQQDPNFYPVALTDGPSTPTSPAWFTATFRIPRFSSPTVYDVEVDVADTAGLGSTTFSRPRMLTVTCARADTTQPVVRWLKVSSASGFPVDVRTRARSVRVSMRITDDLAGVTPSTIVVKLRHIDPPGRWFGSYREVPVVRTSGTARDGWYSGTWTMARGELGGDWAVDLEVRDRAHSVGETYTTDLVRAPGTRAMPGHTGTFKVRGSGDSSRPTLVSVRMSPTATRVTAADGSVVARVAVRVRVKDQGSGVRRVVASVTVKGADAAVVVKERLRPTSGTRSDGVWTFVVDVPAQGLDPGTPLWLHLGVNDLNHQDWYSAYGAWPDGGWRDNRRLTSTVLGGGTGSAAVPSA